MPTLPNQRIRVEAADETTYEASVAVSVLQDGTFSVAVPDDLQGLAWKLVKHHAVIKETGEVKIAKQSGATHAWRLHTKCLAYALNFLRECARHHLNVETVTERVIVYRVKCQAVFYVDGKGAIHQNGADIADYHSDKGEWWGDAANMERFQSYSVGLAARIYDRTIFRRASGDTVRWDEPEKLSDIGKKLNGFIHLDIHPDTRRGFQVVPYTDKAATFFWRMMIGVCDLARNVTAFFADQDRLQKAIENPSLALPLPRPNER